MKHSFVGCPPPLGFIELWFGDGAVIDPSVLRTKFPTMETDFLTQYRGVEKISEDERIDIFVRSMVFSAKAFH
jgi:hypothetical protein